MFIALSTKEHRTRHWTILPGADVSRYLSILFTAGIIKDIRVRYLYVKIES